MKAAEKTVKIARQLLANGNVPSYCNVMQGAMRRAMTLREKRYLEAILIEDGVHVARSERQMPLI